MLLRRLATRIFLQQSRSIKSIDPHRRSFVITIMAESINNKRALSPTLISTKQTGDSTSGPSTESDPKKIRLGSTESTFATDATSLSKTSVLDPTGTSESKDASNSTTATEPATTGNDKTAPSASTSSNQQQPPKLNKHKHVRQPKQQKSQTKPGGAEEVGGFDVLEHLGQLRIDSLEVEGTNDSNGPTKGGSSAKSSKLYWRKKSEAEWGFGAEGKIVQVKVQGLSAHGDGLALLTPSGSTEPTRLVTIPFTLPGELVTIKVTRHEPDLYLSHADLIEIVEPSKKRFLPADQIVELPDRRGKEPSEALKLARKKFGNRVQCQYFGTCSGCQYQPLAYEDQLEIKRTVVEKAFKNFSNLSSDLIPKIGDTLPSPLEYQYRTKLTPHFQSPPAGPPKSKFAKNSRGSKGKEKENADEDQGSLAKEWELTIGFDQKGRKRVIDIEECVIATKIINEEYKVKREEVKRDISKYKRGSTLLLRDSLPPRGEGVTKKHQVASTLVSNDNEGIEEDEAHVCITDHHATVREKVGTNEFEQVAGSFFQNNSSILPSLMETIAETVRSSIPKMTHLIDAYCGSGLFAISLADQFEKIEGVEIDKQSVKWAKMNAEWNKGPGRGEVGFRDGKAEDIFGTIDFPQDSTTILIDPPRKGCDELFLSQLLKFNPASIIYVSCNVHTQARDVGWIVEQSKLQAAKEGKGKKGFWIESLRAADLFANTHHAEGLAILRREV